MKRYSHRQRVALLISKCIHCLLIFLIIQIIFGSSDFTISFCRYPCNECGSKFATGQARAQHRCSRPAPPAKRRIIDPPGTKSAIEGLFKIIELHPMADNLDIVDDLDREIPRIVDIIR